MSCVSMEAPTASEVLMQIQADLMGCEIVRFRVIGRSTPEYHAIKKLYQSLVTERAAERDKAYKEGL